MFTLAVGYEVIMLKGSLIGTIGATPTKSSSSATPTSFMSSSPKAVRAGIEIDSSRSENIASNAVLNTPRREASPPPPQSPPASAARIPISPGNGETTAERIRAAMEPVQTEGDTPPAYTPLKKPRRSSIGSSVRAASPREPVQASALTLESKAADADDDPDVSSNVKKSLKSSLSNTDANSPTDRDIEPPKQRRRPKPRDGGSEPGEGENFWQWFQETKGSEGGAVGTSLNCPEGNKRLCQMFYKYLRKYKIRTVFDASCGTNLDWLQEVLQKAGSELWGFKFYCSAIENDKRTAAKEKLGKLNFVEFISDQWWRDGYPEDTELLFAWDVLPHIAYGRVWNFFVKAKKQDIRYILVDNYPGILNDPVRHPAPTSMHFVASVTAVLTSALIFVVLICNDPFSLLNETT